MKQHLIHRVRHGFTLIELLVVVAIIAALIAILLPSMGNAREKAKLVVCMSGQRQLVMAHQMYSNEHKEMLMRLHRNLPLPTDPIVDWYGPLCWPDMMRKYVAESRDIFDCPSAADIPGREVRLGIGMNHIQLSYAWDGVKKELYVNDVRTPGASVLFADAGRIRNYTDTDPDNWYEDPGFQLFFFLTPDHPAYHNPPEGPGFQRRPFNRHLDRTATVHLDGHGEAMPVSQMGIHNWPGANGATGDTVIGGGNGKHDPSWLWDRY